MITVLKSREEVDKVLAKLHDEDLPLHVTPQKNWDHFLIKELTRDKSRDLRIVDVGSGDGYTLEFLHRLGFDNISGIDLSIPRRRLVKRFFRRMVRRRFVGTDLVRRGDMCNTGLPDASVDLITSVSVIEHNVPKRAFLEECARILRPEGVIYLSTDYWEDAEMDDGTRVPLFDTDWTIQNKPMIEELVRMASEADLELLQASDIPATGERTVSYYGYEYTFIALEFTKRIGVPSNSTGALLTGARSTQTRPAGVAP